MRRLPRSAMPRACHADFTRSRLLYAAALGVCSACGTVASSLGSDGGSSTEAGAAAAPSADASAPTSDAGSLSGDASSESGPPLPPPCELPSAVHVLGEADMGPVLVDDAHVYFYSAGSIRRIPRCGGEDELVLDQSVGTMLGEGPYLFVVGQDETVRVDKVTLAKTVTTEPFRLCTALAEGGGRLYALTTCSDQVPSDRTWTLARTTEDGGAWETLGTGSYGSTGNIFMDVGASIALDDDYVYATRALRVERTRLDAAEWETLVTLEGEPIGPSALVVGGGNLFFDFGTSSTQRVSVDGGDPVPVTTGVPIAFEAGRLTVADPSGVRVTDRDGTDPDLRLVRNRSGVAVRSDRFYWAEGGLLLTATREPADEIGPVDDTPPLTTIRTPSPGALTHAAARAGGGYVVAGHTCSSVDFGGGVVPADRAAVVYARDASGAITWGRVFPQAFQLLALYAPLSPAWLECGTDTLTAPVSSLKTDGLGRVYVLATDYAMATPRTLLRRLSPQGQDDVEIEVESGTLGVANDGSSYIARVGAEGIVTIDVLDDALVSTGSAETAQSAGAALVGAAGTADGAVFAATLGQGDATLGTDVVTIGKRGSLLGRIDASGSVTRTLLEGAVVQAIAPTEEGGWLVAGVAAGFVDLGRGKELVGFPGSDNLFVARYDGAGTVTWVHFGRVDGPPPYMCTPLQFAVADDRAKGAVLASLVGCGDSILLGTPGGLGNAQSGSFAARFDDEGSLLWGRALDELGGTPAVVPAPSGAVTIVSPTNVPSRYEVTLPL